MIRLSYKPWQSRSATEAEYPKIYINNDRPPGSTCLVNNWNLSFIKYKSNCI